MGDTITSTQSSPSLEIVDRVAEMEEQDPLDLPPLYDSIDPDALDRLSKSNKIQFEYAGYKITIDSGTIRIDQ